MINQTYHSPPYWLSITTDDWIKRIINDHRGYTMYTNETHLNIRKIRFAESCRPLFCSGDFKRKTDVEVTQTGGH